MERKRKAPESAAALQEKIARLEKELEALKMESLFLAALFDGISEEIMVVDRSHTIRDANRAFLKAVRLRKEEVLGRKCYEIKEKATAPCAIKGDRCPMEIALETGKRVEAAHIRKTPEGRTRECFLLMYPLKGGSRVPEYFIEIVRDVTEYRNLIRRLQYSEKKLRTILDTATSAILSIDEDHKIVLFNEAAQQMFGYAPAEILGKDLEILVPARYGNHREFVQRFKKTREPSAMGKTLHFTAIRKGGEEFPIELSVSHIVLEDKMTFTGIIRDVSQEQQLERKLLQSERLAAVGQAVAHVAHELRNPLMIIGGFAGQIRRGLKEEKDGVKMDMILEEVKRLEHLVSGLGDFTKTYRLVKRPTDLAGVIQDVIKIMSGVYPSDKYSFMGRYDRAVGEIDCDPDKLKQVLINLFSNGCEAMPEGGRITVSVEQIAEGVEIRIGDEGVGIPEEQIQHLFEPFYTTREKGFGLGLAIAYKIIQAHGGEIYAESRPGRGTTFIIRFPS